MIAKLRGHAMELTVYDDKVVTVPLAFDPLGKFKAIEFLMDDIDSVDIQLPMDQVTAGTVAKEVLKSFLPGRNNDKPKDMGIIVFNIREEAKHEYGLQGGFLQPKSYIPNKFYLEFPMKEAERAKAIAEFKAKVEVIQKLFDDRDRINVHSGENGNTVSDSVDVISELKKLAEMKAAGYLSDSEFDDLKAKLMGKKQ